MRERSAKSIQLDVSIWFTFRQLKSKNDKRDKFYENCQISFFEWLSIVRQIGVICWCRHGKFFLVKYIQYCCPPITTFVNTAFALEFRFSDFFSVSQFTSQKMLDSILNPLSRLKSKMFLNPIQKCFHSSNRYFHPLWKGISNICLIWIRRWMKKRKGVSSYKPLLYIQKKRRKTTTLTMIVIIIIKARTFFTSIILFGWCSFGVLFLVWIFPFFFYNRTI